MTQDNNPDFDRDAITKARNTVRELQAGFEHQCEAQKILAKLFRAKYEALVECGFDKTEALQIIMARGLS